MAKQIILLERVDEPSDNNFRVAFWLTVPNTRWEFYANANATSQYKHASAQELQDIVDGKVQEIVETVGFEAGTGLPAIKADLISKFTKHQNRINNINPWVRYGVSYNGTAWSAGGIV